MTFPRRAAALVLAAFAIFAGGSSLRATSVLPPTFSEMIQRSEIIFTGKVTAMHSTWSETAGARSIVTRVAFEVVESHKGRAAKTVTLEFMGGRVGEVSMEVSGMPQFEVGQTAVLFVERGAGQASPLVGLYHGRFHVVKDRQTGQQVVLRHDGKPLRDVSEVGGSQGAHDLKAATRPAPTRAARTPMSVEEFRTAIRREAGKAPR